VQYTIYSVNAAWGDDPTSFFTDSSPQVVPAAPFVWRGPYSPETLVRRGPRS